MIFTVNFFIEEVYFLPLLLYDFPLRFQIFHLVRIYLIKSNIFLFLMVVFFVNSIYLFLVLLFYQFALFLVWKHQILTHFL